jgi:3-dehydroquinate synthase
LISLNFDRRSAVVAVGGGVVGDLGGFVASTFLRGVPFYSVPTSLLAMVDASVGGKVGIDLPEGKNLVGQFYPARVVAVDPELLSTLPLREWSGGMAEVIKHGILSGPELWSLVTGFGPENRGEKERLNHLITEAVGVKVGVVSQDPYERTGLRATLNLGHSYGHAIEWCSGYGLGHGEAVGLGLLAGVRLSKAMGLLQQDFEPELVDVLKRWRLPTVLPSDDRYTWEALSLALSRDKKNKDGRWCFILPVKVGRVETVEDAPKSMVRDVFLSLKGKQD